jgi:hypothetical protein
MNTASPIPAHKARSSAELETSFKAFQKKVDANYREFFSDAPTPAHTRRLWFHWWLETFPFRKSPRKKSGGSK